MTISYPVYYFFTGDVLFTAQIDCSEDAPDAIKKRHAVLWAVAKDQSLLRYADLRYADLSYADLRYADLRDADLSYANLRYANLRGAVGYLPLPVADPRGYHHHAIWYGNEWRIRAGCRNFSISEARKHWLSDDYDGPAMVRDKMAFAIDWLEKQETPKEDKQEIAE